MKPEVRAALTELRSEIDTLAASVLARSRFAAPEILTSRRVSFGSASAAVLMSEPAPVPILVGPPVTTSVQSGTEGRERAQIAPTHAERSGRNEISLLQRLIAFVRRLLGPFTG